jgi:hypothetical protein
MAIMKADCFWADPTADIAAKAIQSAALSDFLAFSRDNRIQAICKSIDVMIDAVELPIFRARVPLDPVYLRIDDAPEFRDPSWQHLHEHYQILNGFIENAPEGNRFDFKYGARLVNLFDTPDLRERTFLASLLIAMGATKPWGVKDYLKLILNCLAAYREGLISHFAVLPALIVLNESLRFQAPRASDPESLTMYETSILPLLKGDHLCAYQEQLLPVIDTFLRTLPGTAPAATWRVICANFPFSQCRKAVTLLNLLATVIPKCSPESLKKGARPILGVFGRCVSMGHPKLASAVRGFLRRSEVAPFLRENAPMVVQILVPVLAREIRHAWVGTTAGIWSDALAAVAQLDPAMAHSLVAPGSPVAFDHAERNWTNIGINVSAIDPGLTSAEWFEDLAAMAHEQDYEPAGAPPTPGPVARAESDAGTGRVVLLATAKSGLHVSNNRLIEKPTVVLPRLFSQRSSGDVTTRPRSPFVPGLPVVRE